MGGRRHRPRPRRAGRSAGADDSTRSPTLRSARASARGHRRPGGPPPSSAPSPCRLGEFLGPAGELERDAVGVLEVERPHVDAGMHGRRHLRRALVVVEHRPDANALVLEPLPVLVELLGGHVEGEVVQRAHRADDLADAGDRRGRRNARHAVGSLGEPEERDAVTVARVEEEVLAHAAGQVERLDQRHAEHLV